MASDWLAARRREKHLSQKQLGLEILRALGKENPSGAYSQKLVSYWEHGHLRPTEEQRRKLAAVLGCDYETLCSQLSSEAPTPTTEVLRRLLPSSRNERALAIVCFNSPPKAPSDPDTFKAVVDVINKGVTFALVVPYPIANSPNSLVTQYYGVVHWHVHEYARELFEQVTEDGADERVKLFVPKFNERCPLFPPNQERSMLVVRLADELPSMDFYVWVKTLNQDALLPAARESPDDALSPTKCWNAYLGEIIQAWIREPALSADACARFKVWELRQLK